MSRLNGMRGICGLSCKDASGKPAFWVMLGAEYEASASGPSFQPEVALLAESNLVTLPSPHPGATRTPWETRFLEQGGGGKPLQLADEAAADEKRQQLMTLCDLEDEDEEDDTKSVDLTDEDVVSSASNEIKVGSLVRGQLSGGAVAVVEELVADCTDPSKSAVVLRLLRDGTGLGGGSSGSSGSARSGAASLTQSCILSDLTLVAEDQLLLEAVCAACGEAEPEDQQLICEGFGKACLSSAHAGCLQPTW
ncbi:unnamed protein product [Polarella glacialis]|uniref:Uncharacterized protein n=1 Tax=Polarella glacialis TaxID=89957 RepID=A0A813FLR5_POLGL|nr:unnamed protein product [Polarella glacialis]